MLRCRFSNVLFIATLAFSLQACLGGLGGHSQPVQYQLLTARAEHNSAAPFTGKSIGIGPVQVAQFLQRPQVVTHGGDTQMHVEDNVRWGEPLDQGIQRVLLQNIAALTGAETRNFPWRQNTVPDYALRVDVIDFDKLSNGEFIIDANWILEDLKNSRILKTQQERIGSNKSYDDLLTQLSQHVLNYLPANN